MPIQTRAEIEALIASRLSGNTGDGITAKDLRDVLSAIVGSAYWQGEGVGPAGADGRNVSGVREITAAEYTLTTADRQFVLECKRSGPDDMVIALPSDAQAAFGVGDAVHITQAGSAKVRIVAGGGITLHLPPEFRAATAATGYSVTVYKVGPNRWRMVGNPEPQAWYFSHFLRVLPMTEDATFDRETVRTWREVTSETPVALTIPAAADLPDVYSGAETFLAQAGAGAVTIAGAAGVTLLVPAGKEPRTAAQHAVLHVVKVGDNTWRVRGDLADAT